MSSKGLKSRPVQLNAELSYSSRKTIILGPFGEDYHVDMY